MSKYKSYFIKVLVVLLFLFWFSKSQRNAFIRFVIYFIDIFHGNYLLLGSIFIIPHLCFLNLSSKNMENLWPKCRTKFGKILTRTLWDICQFLWYTNHLWALLHFFVTGTFFVKIILNFKYKSTTLYGFLNVLSYFQYTNWQLSKTIFMLLVRL